MQKRALLISLDFILICFMGFFSFFLVGQVIHYTPIVELLIMTLGYILALCSVKFYRNRIADSSLGLFKPALLVFSIATLVYIFVLGYIYGFSSFATRWILVFAVLSFCSVMGLRIVYRIAFELKGKNDSSLPVAIVYGAGELGSAMARLALRGKFSYRIKGFIDDNKGLEDEIVLGYPVLGKGAELENILRKNRVDTLIIAITKISSDIIQKAVEIASRNGVNVKIVPNLFETKGRADVSLRDIDYSDLLGRSLITIEKEPLFEMFQGKTVMVTGAGGSIGSEICKQLREYGLKKLVLLDVDETELHDLCLRLLNYEREWSDDVVPVVCDIKNTEKIQKVFEKFKPDIVLHAAAYKHVPLMELYPEEAILTNICGSYNVFNSAAKTGVKRVIVISTDKAVNPTNVMGATKRVVEMFAATFNSEFRDTDYCCVRFGNVIGSRGSMLPLFLEEIKAGRPITVTDRNIIRYFMAIPEAVSLVFRAASLANGGEVMVLDMGEPVKIYDFAKKLIDIFGDGRSEIKITGLRPGEKLYEELLANKDNTIPTVNEKIYKAKVTKNNDFTVAYLSDFVAKLPALSSDELVVQLCNTVPEFNRKAN